MQSVQPSGDLVRRFSGRTIAALVLVILAVVLVGVTMSFSWWNISASDGTSAAFYLTNVCSRGSCQSYQGEPGLQDVFALTNDVVLIGLVLAIFTFILALASVFYPRLGTGTLATGVVGAILLMAAPVYLYAALPGAITTFNGASQVNSFFGSYSQPGAPVWYAWGGGTGWYLGLAAFAVLLVSSIIAFSASRGLSALGNFRPGPAHTLPSAVPYSPVAPLPSREVFCPTCGSHYPAGTLYCNRDATPLKEIPR